MLILLLSLPTAYASTVSRFDLLKLQDLMGQRQKLYVVDTQVKKVIHSLMFNNTLGSALSDLRSADQELISIENSSFSSSLIKSARMHLEEAIDSLENDNSSLALRKLDLVTQELDQKLKTSDKIEPQSKTQLSGVVNLTYIQSIQPIPGNYETPYIKLNHDYWDKDPLNAYIVVNRQTQQSQGFVMDVVRAITKWSNLLKQYSGDGTAWNFNIKTPFGFVTTNGLPNGGVSDLSPDILIELVGDPTHKCGVLGITERPTADQVKPIYSKIITSCILENEVVLPSHRVFFSTVMHEFGHILGLGHAFTTDTDLMCSDHTCINSGIEEPSELDIKALFYMYGIDGLNGPHRELAVDSYYKLGVSQ
jgi:hypothetical protein